MSNEKAIAETTTKVYLSDIGLIARSMGPTRTCPLLENGCRTVSKLSSTSAAWKTWTRARTNWWPSQCLPRRTTCLPPWRMPAAKKPTNWVGNFRDFLQHQPPEAAGGRDGALTCQKRSHLKSQHTNKHFPSLQPLYTLPSHDPHWRGIRFRTLLYTHTVERLTSSSSAAAGLRISCQVLCTLALKTWLWHSWWRAQFHVQFVIRDLLLLRQSKHKWWRLFIRL